MKFTATIALLAVSVSSCAAFAPSTLGARQATSLSAEETSRSQFIQQSLAAAAAFAVLPQTASAAKYGSFGSGSSSVLDPKSAEIDSDILASDSVQKALQGIKGYSATVASMKATLESDPQADIGSAIRRELDFSKLRSDLNAANEAFDEDTQRGTDRIIRVILQDITELETANRQKPGIPRSEIRLGNMKAKLDKLGKAFGEYLTMV